MAAPTPFIRSLIRVANKDGREVLESIITGQFTVLKDSGGKQLTGVTAGGKSFTYTVPPSLSIEQLMGAMEEALEFFDSMTAEQVANYLKRRPESRTRVFFG